MVENFDVLNMNFFLIGVALVRDQVLLLVKPLRTNRSKGGKLWGRNFIIVEEMVSPAEAHSK